MNDLLLRFRTSIVFLVIALVAAGFYFGFFKGQFGTTASTANRIVFVASAAKNATLSDIYTINSDGSGLLKISTDIKTQGIDPTWNKGKTSLFYAANVAHFQIMRMDPYGNVPTILTFGPTEKSAPSVSPDGKKVAFVDSTAPGKSDLEIYDFTTSTVLKQETSGINLSPSWASNTKLIYVRQDDKGNNLIYSVEGNTETNLTSGLKVGKNFAISPDGNTIAYLNRDDGQIYTMGLDGKNKKVLTKQSDGKLGVPSYSPDGKELVAVLTPTNQDSELVRINTSTGALTVIKITASIFNLASPNWSRR